MFRGREEIHCWASFPPGGLYDAHETEERGRVVGNGADAMSPQLKQHDVQPECDEAAVDRALNLAVPFVGRERQRFIPAGRT